MVYTPEVGREKVSKVRGIGDAYEKILQRFGIMNKDDLISAINQLVEQHEENAGTAYKELLKEMIPNMADKWADESWNEITLLAAEKAAYISNIVPPFDYSILEKDITSVPFIGSARAAYLCNDGITKVGDIIHIWLQNCNRDFRVEKMKKERYIFTERIRAYNNEAQYTYIDIAFNWLWDILMHMTLTNDPSNAQLAVEDSSRCIENGTNDADKETTQLTTEDSSRCHDERIKDQGMDHTDKLVQENSSDNNNWSIIIGAIAVGMGVAGVIANKPRKLPLFTTSATFTFFATFKCLYDMSVSYKKISEKLKGVEAKIEDTDFIRNRFIHMMSCPICLTGDVAPNRDVILPCGHVMHAQCRKEFVRNHWNNVAPGEPIACPLCRSQGVNALVINIPYI